MRVTLQPYNPEWAVRFEEVREELSKILHQSPPVSIEHVGSTSIPGLIAKPVLDIDIVVRPQALAESRAALVSAGYTDLGDLGIPGRIVFRQPGFGRHDMADGSGETMRRNTYVIFEGCQSLKNHLDLRRVLLSDEKLRDEYGQVKERLAALDLVDVDEYCRGKNAIMLKILKAAGWSEEELDEVAKVNV